MKMDSGEKKLTEAAGGGEKNSEMYLDECKGDDDLMRKTYGVFELEYMNSPYGGDKAAGGGGKNSEMYLDECKGDDDLMRKTYGVLELEYMDSPYPYGGDKASGGGEKNSEMFLDECKGDDDLMRKTYGVFELEYMDSPYGGDKMKEEELACACGCENTSELSMDEILDWAGYRDDDDIMRQTYDICDQEALKIPSVGDKEPLSTLEAEYQSGSPIMVEKIKVLGENYGYIRRTRGDVNSFFRGFMFGYLEYILVSQDRNEVGRVKINVEQCKKTLEGLGYQEFTFEVFFSSFLEQLDSVLQGSGNSISVTELVQRCRDEIVSEYVLMFFRFITSGEIKSRAEFFASLIMGLSDSTVEQFCKSSVEPIGEESGHVNITALSDALGVPIRVVYLDKSASDSGDVIVNHHDFIPDSLQHSSDGGLVTIDPKVTLLYRPGHYDILYLK